MNNYLTLAGIVLAVLATLYVLNMMSSPMPATEEQEKGAEGYDNKKDKKDVKEHMTTGYRRDAGHPSPYEGETLMGDTPLSSTQAGCPSTAHLRPEDLLPQDDASAWAKMYPTGQGSLANKNHLQAGALVGIDTVGQTLRNANLQLRSEPPNPRIMVSPWLNSTIEADTNRRPFELGQC